MKLHDLMRELEGLAASGLRDAEVVVAFRLRIGLFLRTVVGTERGGPGPERVVLIVLTEQQVQAAEEKADEHKQR